MNFMENFPPCNSLYSFLYFNPYPRICSLILEIGEWRERHRGRETLVTSCTPLSETKPTTQAYALTGNWTYDLLAHQTTLQPTEPHWPGLFINFLERERERNVDLVFHLSIYSLVDSCMCPDQGIKPATLAYRHIGAMLQPTTELPSQDEAKSFA